MKDLRLNLLMCALAFLFLGFFFINVFIKDNFGMKVGISMLVAAIICLIGFIVITIRKMK